MSLPDLPSPFGNNALRGMAEIVSPEPISWMPQTTGWLLLGALLGLLLIRRSIRLLGAWHANRYRREAKKHLGELVEGASEDNFLAAVNSLLKRAAIAAYSREQVAALHGSQWVRFLNTQCEVPPFSERHQQWLASAVYGNGRLTEDQRRDLIIAAQQWLEQHQRDADA